MPESCPLARVRSSRGLCMQKNGWDSVASRAALGRSSVTETTRGPTTCARAGEGPLLAQVVEVRHHRGGVERRAVVEAHARRAA